MARILIGWELGGGHGHTSRLLDLAAVLTERGHTPLFAPQQIGPFAAHGPTWQPPVWPRLLSPLARTFERRPATMGDILAYLGLDDPAAMAAMIMAWDRILQDAQPDAVVAEYAPILQLAARGRIPTLGFGTGFSLPPGHLPEFPSFLGEPAVHDESGLLSGLNVALRSAGREELPALPAIFAADHRLVASFDELDPYRDQRREAVGAPAGTGDVPPATGNGEELFVYFNGSVRRPTAFWRGVVASRLPVRVFDPLIDDTIAATLERDGIMVERGPVPFAEIVTRSRMLLSHGGSGFVSSGLMAGLPQVIIPFDVEKRLIANALAERGLCLMSTFAGLDPEAFAVFLRAAWDDDALRGRAEAAGPDFRARVPVPSVIEAADKVELLL